MLCDVLYSVTLGSNDMVIERDIRKHSGGNIKGLRYRGVG